MLHVSKRQKLLEVVRAAATSNHLKVSTAVPTTQVEKRNHLKSFAEIPGPRGIYRIPYVGFMLHFEPFTNESKYKLYRPVRKLFNKYGSIFQHEVGGYRSVFVYEPGDIEKVFKVEAKNPFRTPIKVFEVYCNEKSQPKGLGITNGEEWASLRKPAQYNMLRPRTVQRYFPLISEVSDDFVRVLAKKQHVPDVRKELMGFAIENAAYLAFSRRLHCLENDNKEFIEAFHDFFDVIGKSLFEIPVYTFYKTKMYKKFEKAADYLYGFVDKETTRALQELREAESKGEFDADSTPHLLHQLLTDKRMPSRESVNSMLIDIFNAGGDTTASAMTFLLYNLARNEDVQEKLYKEIVKHLPPDGTLTDDAMKKMSYVKACLKESFRTNFPLPIGVNRQIGEDLELQGYLVPKGSIIVMVMNDVLTMNPAYFPEPEKFYPERWLRGRDDGAKIPFGMLPFSFGARSCMGQRFAELEIHVAITKLIQHFKVSLHEPGKIYDIVHKPFPATTEPLALNFTPR